MTFADCFIRLDSAPGGSSTWPHAPGAVVQMLRCDPPYESAQLRDRTGVIREWADPIDALRWLGTDAQDRDWIGWLSYDLGRWFEKLPSTTRNDLRLPLFVFTAHDDAPAPVWPDSELIGVDSELKSTFTRAEYEQAVAKVIEYIRAGDIFQVNLSQRMSVRCDAPASTIYRRLQTKTPSTHAACLDYGDHALICNSPELFLRVTPDRRVVTRPIKGTRPRGPGMREQLHNSLKDQAELNMIVDLERNDLGRVCEIGSVKVTEPRQIEEHPTIYHGVATIEGILRPEITFVDLLKATFPGGSITGAPKIRAMEIIEELEPVRRGPYCGAIGHLGKDGTIEFNIAIRTMVLQDKTIHIPVGGGIVADSRPADEYEETLVKARAMLAALGIAATAT